MRLKILHEMVSTAAIAMGPGSALMSAKPIKRKKKLDEYGYLSITADKDMPKNKIETRDDVEEDKKFYPHRPQKTMKQVWQPEKTGGGKGTISSPNSSIYASKVSLRHPYAKMGI